MISRVLLAVSALLLWSFALPVPAQLSSNGSFALKNGDRVVFYGDSITAQRRYTRFVEDIVVTRYPGLRIAFYNAGVSGDTVNGGHAGNQQERLARDVFPLRPSVMSVMLGMNDGLYTTSNIEKNLSIYQTGYREWLASVRAHLPDTRLYLIEPSPYDEIAHAPLIPGYNGVLRQYGEFVNQLGRRDHLAVVNFDRPMEDALRSGMLDDPKMAGTLMPDRIHPSPAGQWIMAVELARAWGVDPMVSSVTIDASAGKIISQQNTAVNDIQADGSGLSWSQLDRSLPLGLQLSDSMTQFLLRVSNLASMDKQLLRVFGLTAPHYRLLIDGNRIAEFTPEQLADGVNLALLQTPMEQQAQSIDWTAEDRAKLSGTRFDLLTQTPAGANRDGAISELDSLDQHEIDAEYHSAQPRLHKFQLSAYVKP